MTWLWAICFSVAASAATVSGKVELADSKTPTAGVIVWLEPLTGKPESTPPATVTVAHKNKTFVPHVVALRTGSRAVFPNLDPFFHNAFSNYDGQVFDVGLRPPGSSPEIVFRRSGVVRLFCNIHPTMSAVIVVLDSPYFTAPGAKGEYAISNVPPGDYRLKLFHERALPEVLRALESTVTITAGDLTLPVLAVSEAGYLPAPHKNKFGKDYPAVVEDQYPNPARKQ